MPTLVLSCASGDEAFDTGSLSVGGSANASASASATSTGPATASASGTSGTGSAGAGSGDSTGLGTCSLDLAFDFETCDDQFTSGKAAAAGSEPTWECGNPSAFALGPGADATGVWATNLSGYYNDGESSFVQSPALSFADCNGAQITLTLEHWYNFEGGDSNSDGGLLQVSDDEGLNWDTLPGVAEGYYTSQTLTAAHDPVNGNYGFSVLQGSDAWRTSTFDLSPHGGQASVTVRLVFGSDAGTPRAGWYVNTLSISSP
jgi:hypothetical protein